MLVYKLECDLSPVSQKEKRESGEGLGGAQRSYEISKFLQEIYLHYNKRQLREATTII